MAHVTFFKHQLTNRVEAKRKAKADAEKDWRALCRVVDARDKGRCRVCGRRCDPDATDMLRRAERHHIVYRSAGGQDTPENVLVLCLGCHQDEHAHRLKVDGNAETGIEIWRRDAAGEWFMCRRETAVGVVEHD